MTTEQASRSIAVFDSNAADWNLPAALKWSWGPPADAAFTAPVAARLRDNARWGGKVMVVGSTGGYFGIVAYPAKTSRYASRVAAADNLHGVELLPNGNVAVASSTGGYVRIYAASAAAAPANTKFAEDKTAELDEAHQVLWDRGQNALWALAYKHLCRYTNTGTPAAPALGGRTCYPTPWPSGHDLQPLDGNANVLVVVTGSYVYTFDKTTNAFTEIKEPAGVSRRGVKGIGLNSTIGAGQWVETLPNGVACNNTWDTDTVEFVGASATKRTKKNACFYRATFWTDTYE